MSHLGSCSVILYTTNMNKDSKNILIALALLAAIGTIAFLLIRQPSTTEPPTIATSTPQVATTTESISDGTITLAYTSQEFGLAVSPEQVLVRSYIPPCGDDFSYCFYYIAPDYQGTNFENAGFRVRKRDDLATQTQCLQTLPEGYAGITSKVSPSANFSTSVFSPLGDAGAGHYANGALYRLAYKGSCYEFETRIGATQYANYPRGTIKEFMPADQRAMNEKLLQLLKNVTLPGGAKPFSKAL